MTSVPALVLTSGPFAVSWAIVIWRVPRRQLIQVISSMFMDTKMRGEEKDLHSAVEITLSGCEIWFFGMRKSWDVSF